MGVVFRVAEFWWLILPVVGMTFAALKALNAKGRAAEPSGVVHTDDVVRREITRLLDQHDQTNARWLAYELDVAKLLDFPMMTDMRNPFTMGFTRPSCGRISCGR